MQILPHQGNSASHWHGKSASPLPPTLHLLMAFARSQGQQNTHSWEHMKRVDTYTGLKV